MIWIADWLARRIWWLMLWFLRRPRIRRLRRRTFGFDSAAGKERRRESVLKQEALARRYGLQIVRVSLVALILSVALTGVWYIVLWMYGQGMLNLT